MSMGNVIPALRLRITLNCCSVQNVDGEEVDSAEQEEEIEYGDLRCEITTSE